MLPNDISNIINQLIHLPEIDIVRISQLKFVFCIKSQFITTELPMRTPYFVQCYDFDDSSKYEYNLKHNGKIRMFINQLNSNVDCVYDESDYHGASTEIFRIGIVNNNIVVGFGHYQIGVSKIRLPIECSKQLITAMEKYHDLLNTT